MVGWRAPGAARLLFAHLRKLFSWSLERLYVEASPCHGLRGPTPAKARDRWLSDEELRLVWAASTRLGEPFGPLIKLLILTGQRREEVNGMTGGGRTCRVGAVRLLRRLRHGRHTAEFGGDLLHRVISPTGQPSGAILWEVKRTKNWSDGWLTKLRDDQRAAKADVALIVSHALPKGMQSFDLVDGVWVSEPRCAVPVAIAIRQTLIQVAGARVAGEGQQTKMELVYDYLTGPQFRHRIEAIVERFTEMQEDLDRERKAMMMRMWAKREAQIRGVVEATAGMYGDLQGITGRRLQEIEGLELALLEGPDE